MKTIPEMIMNIFVIGFVAAFTEEVFFRGMIQKYLNWLTQKPHLAIWITAIVFSALHGQFYGFIPRMILGAALGYVYFFSGKIWLSILGHFINNALQVVVSYVYLQSHSLEELAKLEIGGDYIYGGITSGILAFTLLFWWCNKKQKAIHE